MRIQIPNNWRPRSYQRPAWAALERGTRRVVLNWHRRAGKDDMALHWAAVAAFRRVATYWHMLPQYSQGRKAIWEAVNPHTGKRRIDEAFPPALRARTDNQTMTIELANGSHWHVVGSDNYDSLVGSPPAGVVFSEWALADPASWAYIRPIIDENDGWAVFIYTSRGRNHGWSMYEHARNTPGWFVEQLKANETGVFTPEQLAIAKQEYIDLYAEGPGAAMYEQEYFCSFDAAVLGSYYSKLLQDAEDEGRIAAIGYDQSLPVETWWDLGVGDSTAIWFAQTNRAGVVKLIDYHQASGEGMPYYAKVLSDKGYIYSRHIGPHDIKHREFGSGKSRREIARSLGVEFTVAPQQSLEDGISAVRALLPNCWFDRVKCKQGLEALRSYRTHYDQKTRRFRTRPLHDWSSHACDAFRYGAVSPEYRELTQTTPDDHLYEYAGDYDWMAG